jgi:hypothetical protein
MSLDFNCTISEDTLHAYLSRALSLCNELISPTMEDDLRMIANLKALFLGRAIYPFEWVNWQTGYDGDEAGMHARAKDFIGRCHAIDPHIIVQGICAEATFPWVNHIPVPARVFEEFGQPVEARSFCLEEMLHPNSPPAYVWENQDLNAYVLDLARPETQRWMYYRCRTLIDAGCEAIHMGQPHWYAEHDRGAQILEQLLQRVRSYARRAARRGMVLLDAHTHGIARNHHLLFDFHARPISAVSWREKPYRIILQLKGSSMGGISPSGWSCRSLPYLIEIDNWGGYSIDLADWHDLDKRASRRWGWDDIAWFAHQPRSERDHFLQYAHRWLRLQDPAAHFQMPARRLLHHAAIITPDGTRITDYHANRSSPACPLGFDQEDTIARLWAEPDPDWLGAWDKRLNGRQPALLTFLGQTVPEPVALVGELQRVLGGQPGDTVSPYSRLVHSGAGRFELAALIPWAGEYPFTVALGGTMTEVINQGGRPGGRPFLLCVPQDNMRVRFSLDYELKRLEAIDDAANSLLKSED